MIAKGIFAGSALLLLATAPAFAAGLPGEVPRHAAEAMALAQKWQRDAILIAVDTQSGNGYALTFDFRSATTRNRFSASFANGRMTSQVQPPVSANDGGALPLAFLDLPAALAEAKKQGLSSPVKEASLGIEGGRVIWSLEADTDHPPYEFTVNAGGTVSAPPMMVMAAKMTRRADPVAGTAAIASACGDSICGRRSAVAEGQHRLRAQRLQKRARPLSAGSAAGPSQRHGGAGHHVPRRPGRTEERDAGGGVVHTGGGGRQSRRTIFAGQHGRGRRRHAQKPARAVQLYEASARQGMPEAQMALGMDYELGQGVPRNRRTAIFWLNEAAKQGDGRAQWIAGWLSHPGTPQFANETQLGRYIDGQVGAQYASQIHPAAGPVGGGPSASERNYRAADAESLGDYDRAGSCRGGGACP